MAGLISCSSRRQTGSPPGRLTITSKAIVPPRRQRAIGRPPTFRTRSVIGTVEPTRASAGTASSRRTESVGGVGTVWKRATPGGHWPPGVTEESERTLFDCERPAQLVFDLREWTEDERLVVGRATPEDSEEWDAGAPCAEDGRAAVTGAHDGRAIGIADKGLAEQVDRRTGDTRVHAGPVDFALGPAGGATNLVHFSADSNGPDPTDGERAGDREAAVVRARGFCDRAEGGRGASGVGRARGVTVATLLVPRTSGQDTLRVLRIVHLGRDHRWIGAARRLVVRGRLDATLRGRAMRVGDERALAANRGIEAERAEVPGEVDLDSAELGVDLVAQRGRHQDGLRHFDRVVRLIDAEAAERVSHAVHGRRVLHAEHHLPGDFVVVGEHRSGQRHDFGRRALENRLEAGLGDGRTCGLWCLWDDRDRGRGRVLGGGAVDDEEGGGAGGSQLPRAVHGRPRPAGVRTAQLARGHAAADGGPFRVSRARTFVYAAAASRPSPTGRSAEAASLA